MSKYAKNLGRNVQRLLNERGVSKSALARESEVSRPVIDSILSGESNPELKTVDKIAAFFGVDTLDLLRSDFDPESSNRDKNEHVERVPSQVLSTVLYDLEALRLRLEGIPGDVLDLLNGLGEEEFETLRKILLPLQPSKAAKMVKKSSRTTSR